MDEEQPAENAAEVVDERPIGEKIGDKNWKARVSAYDELRNRIKNGEGADLFAEFASWLTKMTADTNAGALDAGIDCALAFVDAAPLEVISLHVDKVISNVVDKAFGGKASTLTKGKALLLKLMEIDEPTACTTYLLSKLADKKPKIPPTCLDIIKEGIGLYGIRQFPVKELIKSLGPVFNGSNGPARESAMTLLVEIYRWIGLAPIQTLLDSVRSAQKSDFEKIIAEKEEEFKASRPVPSLYLRKERPLPGSEVNNNNNNDSNSNNKHKNTAAGSGGSGDAREYVEEVDIMKKLKNSEFATLVAEEKWNEQLKGLQLVIDAIGPTPKIKPGSDVHDIISVCKGFLRQGHVLLQVNSLKIIALLADGLRSEFSHIARTLMQSIIQKSKEKKLIADVQATTIMILQHCIQMDSFAEDVFEIFTNKKNPPHSKIGIMELVITILSTMPEKINNDNMKPLADSLLSMCEDSDVKVRETCGVALGTLAPVVKSRGRFASDAYKALMALEQSAPRVFKKMQAAIESAAAGNAPTTSATTATAKSTTGTTKAAPKSTVESTNDDDIELPKPNVATKRPGTASTTSSAAPSTITTTAVSKSASALPKKTSSSSGIPAKSTTSSTTAGGAKKAKASDGSNNNNNNNDEEPEELTMNPDEAKEILGGLGIDNWDTTFQTQMASAKWQDKVDALAILERKLIETKSGGQYSAALVKYISAQTTGFKISNINVMKSVIQTTCSAVQNAGDVKFNKPAAWELIKQFGDKLSDKKTKENVDQILTALAEQISPGFVYKGMKNVMDKTKSPQTHQYFLEWLKQAITDFGFSAFPVQQIGAFCQIEMDNKISAIRVAAVEVMGALHHQIGPRLLSIAISDDMKPQLKALLEAEFAKVGHDPTAAAKANKASADSGNSSGAIPRQDLLSLVDKNILTELNFVDGKNSWQNRKAAMEAIVTACERSGHYLEANKATGEIVKALKARINDTQANLKPLAVTAIGHIIAALDPDSGIKVLRIVAPGMMLGIADNKKQMRDSTIAALHTAVTLNKQPSETAPAESNMLMSLMPSICEALVNVIGRQELLAWLIQHVEAIKGDCNDMAVPLILTSQDKSSVVRAQSEQLLTILMSHGQISKVSLDKATRDLPPASKRALQSMIDKLMACYGTAKKTQQVNSAQATVATSNTVTDESPVEEEEEPVVKASPQKPVPVVEEQVLPARKSGLAGPRAGVAASSSSNNVKQIVSNKQAIAPLVEETVEPVAATEPASPWLLKNMSMNDKNRRMDEFYKINWPQPPEEPADHEFQVLKASWEPHVYDSLSVLLFPVINKFFNQDAFVPAIAELQTQLECPYLNAHMDYVLRWCCYVLCMRETAGGMLRILQLITDLFVAIRTEGSVLLHDVEIGIIIPFLIEKSGHSSERHRAAFKQAIAAAGEIIAPNKITQQLLQGLSSINKRSRVVCLEEIQRIVETAGIVSMGRSGVKEIGLYLDSKDSDIQGRNACLEVIYALYESLSQDQAKLIKMLGSDLSERSINAIEDRIKHKNKAIHGGSNSSNANTPAKALTTSIQTQNTPVNTAIPPTVPRTKPKSTAKKGISSSTHHDSVVASTDESELALVMNDVEVPHMDAMIMREIDAVIASTPMKDSPDSHHDDEHTHKKLFAEDNSISKGAAPRHSTPSKIPNSSSRSNSKTRGEKKAAAVVDTSSVTSSASPAPHVNNNVNINSSNNNLLMSTPASVNKSYVAATPPQTPRTELEGIYLEISKKIDKLVNNSNKLTDSDSSYEGAKDYLKMLHSIISGEWSAEKLPEDETMLQTHVESFAKKLVKCIARSFDNPVEMSSAVPGATLGIDVSLVAISLSTLFALVKRHELAQILSEVCLFEIFYECLYRICDERILHPEESTDTASKETAHQIVMALNMIVIRLASEAATSNVLRALLKVMFLCIPSSEVNHGKDLKSLPPASTKPTSRLIIKVLTDEIEKPQPYNEATFDLKSVLQAVHAFFTKHPANTLDDTPFRTAKTILNEIIKVVGGYRVIAILQEETDISPSSFIYLLTSRLGRIQLTDVDSELHSKIVTIIDEITSSRDKLSAIKELHRIKKQNPTLDIHMYLQKISSAFRRFVLDTLTKLDQTSDDDESATNALIGHQQYNNEFNSSDNVASTSESNDENLVPPQQQHQQQQHSLSRNSSFSNKKSAPTTSQSPDVTVMNNTTSGSSNSKASEAMRILEGLKNRPAQFKQSTQFEALTASGLSPIVNPNSISNQLRRNSFRNSDKFNKMDSVDSNGSDTPGGGEGSSSLRNSNNNNASPFAKRSEKIRDSLSNLTASLDLLTTGATTTTTNASISALAGGNIKGDILLSPATPNK